MKTKAVIFGLFLLTTFPGFAAEGEIEEVLVIGTRASLMSAVEKQEMSDKIISVVDSDALGDFPDTTAAEAIRRLSGISIENDQGEGRYVTIRGLSSDLNAIAINGTSVMSPESDRSTLLDGLPTELLDSITVFKSLTPDQDADAIGGRIEFETKNPTDLNDTLFKIKLDTQYNEQAESGDNARIAVTYGDKFSETAGHVLAFTYSSKDIITYNNETGFGWDSDGLMDDDYEVRYYDLTRERLGFTYDVDSLVGDSSRVFFSAFWNEYTDDELRWKDEYGYLDDRGEVESETSMTLSRIKKDNETRVREEVRTIQAYSAGFDTDFGGWQTTGKVSYSYAEEDDSDNSDVTFRFKEKDDDTIDGRMEWSNPKKPTYTPLIEKMMDPEELEFDEVEFERSTIEDSEVALNYDMFKETEFGSMKFGLKWRSREKDRDANKDFYSFGGKTLADYNPTTFTYFGQVSSPMANPDMVYDLLNQVNQMELEGQETYHEDFVTEEDVFAIYGMGTFSLSDNVKVVAGMRFEDTSWESSAFDQDGVATDANKDYDFWAPSVNLTWALTDNWVMRGAITRTLTRPGFSSTAPMLELDIDGEDISGKYGNPDLEPYESTNFDISFEYYTDTMTFFSVGAFHKDVDNAIYKIAAESGTIRGVEVNDGLVTWINAEESTITGFEINGQYGLESGLFVAANFTAIPEADSTFKFDGENTFTTPFRKMADQNANLSLGYDKGKWDVRLAMSYRSEYLDYLADEEDDMDKVSADNSRFVDSHVQWDLTAKYKVTSNLTAKFEVININDRPEYYYWGRKSRLSQYDEYGTSYSIGLTYSL